MSGSSKTKTKITDNQKEIYEKFEIAQGRHENPFEQHVRKTFIKRTISSEENETDTHNSRLCLTLRFILEQKLESMYRFAFETLQFSTKNIELGKLNKITINRRRSKEILQETVHEVPVTSETGDLIQKTSKYHKKTIYKTRSRGNSPCNSERISLATNTERERSQGNDIKYLLNSVGKTFKKFLARRLTQFNQGSNTEFQKNENKKSTDFRTLKRIQTAKSVSVFSDDSRGKSPSFDEKDKEIWRRRHPIRRHSPSPSDFSGISSHFSAYPQSEQNSPRISMADPFSLERSKINTLVEKVDGSFSKERRDSDFDKKSTVDSDKIKESTGKVLMARPKPKALRSGIPGKNSTKAEDYVELPKRPLTNLEKQVMNKKIGNMVDSIRENHKCVEKKAVDTLKDAVEEDKSKQKVLVTRLLCDFLQIIKDKQEKSFLKDSLDKLKKYHPNKIQLQTPEFKPKKQALRSERKSPFSPSIKVDPSIPDLFAQKIEVLNRPLLKNKLTSFFALFEASRNPNPKVLPALRNMFRIFEAKKFSKIYFTFYKIKNAANQRLHSRTKISIRFFQKQNKIFNEANMRNKLQTFKSICSIQNKSFAIMKFATVLSKIHARRNNALKHTIFYRIHSYSDRNRLNLKLRILKLSHFYNKIYLRKLALAYM